MTVVLKAIRPKRFLKINPERVPANVKRSMKRYLEEVKKELQADYSQVPPGRYYQRTHTLHDNWQIQISPDGSEGTIYNDTPYAVFVQGPTGGGRGTGARQAQMLRRKGWRSITVISRATRPRFKELMNRAVKGESAEYDNLDD